MRNNRYLSNSIFGILQTLVSTTITMIAIPLFIRKLGSEGYGIFATLSVLGNVNIFANLGLNTTIRKFLASQGKSDESNLDIIISLSIVIALAFLISLILFHFSDEIIINVLNIPEHMFYETERLFIYLLLSNIILIVGQIFEAILDSQERIEVTSMLRMLNNILYWALILFVLFVGYGLEMIGLSILITSTLWFLALGIIANNIWGSLDCQCTIENWKKQLKKQLMFSSQVYTAGLVTIVGEPIIKILISHFLGVSMVGYYEIGSRIRSYLSSFLQKLVYPLFPILAREKSVEKCSKIVIILELKIVLLVIPVVVGVIFLSEDFITFWTGQVNPAVWQIMICLVVTYLLLNNTIYPALVYFLSTDYPKIVIYYNFVYGSINMASLIFLSEFLGYYAIIVSELAALILAFVLVIYYQNKIFINPRAFIQEGTSINYLIIFLFLLAVAFIVTQIIDSSLVRLVVLPFLIIIAFVLFLRHFQIFTGEELNWLIQGNTVTKRWLKSVLAIEDN